MPSSITELKACPLCGLSAPELSELQEQEQRIKQYVYSEVLPESPSHRRTFVTLGRIAGKDAAWVHCTACGRYEISNRQLKQLCDHQDQLHLLSAVTRFHWETTGKRYRVSSGWLAEVRSLQHISVTERADRLLDYIERRTLVPGESVEMRCEFDWPLICVKRSEREVLSYLIRHLASAGYIEKVSSHSGSLLLTLTVVGWQYLRPFGGGRRGHVFIAMSYADELRRVFTEGLAAAVRDCGMVPVLQSEDRHTGNITQRMLGQIRSCELVVADLTGERPNVYYEAGFAQALGRPVIFTCRKGEPVHFDTAQFPRIEWTTVEQLRSELADWLRAITPSAKMSESESTSEKP